MTVDLLLTPLYGPYVGAGWGTTFEDAAGILSGVILALVYLSPLKGLYEKPKVDPQTTAAVDRGRDFSFLYFDVIAGGHGNLAMPYDGWEALRWSEEYRGVSAGMYPHVKICPKRMLVASQKVCPKS